MIRLSIRMTNSVTVELPDDGRRFTDIVKADQWPHLDVSRVVVSGGRDYGNRELVFRVLDNLRPEVVIHGDCHRPTAAIGDYVRCGADRWADEWAIDRGAAFARCPANWRKFKKPAGPIRNGWMLKLKPTLVVAFPGGSGTADMKKQTIAAHVQLLTVEE